MRRLALATAPLLFSLCALACDGGESPVGDSDEPDAGSLPGPDAGPDAGPDPEPEPEPEPDAGPAPDELPDGVATLAGGGEPGSDDGLRDGARFNNPVNVEVGPDGVVYVADFDNGLIRAVSDLGEVTTLTARSGFARPFGLAIGADGVLYAQTDRNSRGVDGGALWSIDTDTGAATLLLDDIGRPRGLAELGDGRLVMAFYQEHTVKVYDPATPDVEPVVIAGTPNTPGRDDGVGAAARFNQPYDVVVTGDDLVVVSDLGNNLLRQVDLVSGDVTTFAGTGDAATTDGPLLSAQFNRPQGLAIDSNGDIYVSEIEGYVIRRISGDTVAIAAGDRTGGHRDSEMPLDSRFFGLEGLAAHPTAPLLYISDGNRGDPAPFHRVRRLTLASSPGDPR